MFHVHIFIYLANSHVLNSLHYIYFLLFLLGFHAVKCVCWDKTLDCNEQ